MLKEADENPRKTRHEAELRFSNMTIKPRPMSSLFI